MDRFILYQHFFRYLLTSSLLLCLYTLLNYLGFTIKLQPAIWICMSTYCSLIWTTFIAHQTRLYLCFMHLGWPASRALRSPLIFSGLIMLALCIWQIKDQKMMNHSFVLDCQKLETLGGIMYTINSKTNHCHSKCQKIKSRFTHKISAKNFQSIFWIKSLLPSEQELSLLSSNTTSITKTRLTLTYQEDSYTVAILKLFIRLIILKCLILLHHSCSNTSSHKCINDWFCDLY